MSPDDGLLTEIETPTTTYGLNYGVFGLRENITIGGRTLISYSYTPNNYLLDRSHGDGSLVTYSLTVGFNCFILKKGDKICQDKLESQAAPASITLCCVA